jgi:hypothetical protein
MARKWDPLAEAPSEASLAQYSDWRSSDIALFQSEHPKAPQGRFDDLPTEGRTALIELYERTRARARIKKRSAAGVALRVT